LNGLDTKARLRELLEVEKADEQAVVDWMLAGREERLAPDAWPAARYIGHFRYWREMFARRLPAVIAGDKAEAAPDDIEAENEVHISRDLQVATADLSQDWAKSWKETFTVLGSCTDDDLRREPDWYGVKTLYIAMLRNSYTHPRDHLIDFWLDRGDRARAAALCEDLSGVTSEFADQHPRFPGASHFYRGLAFALRGDAQPALEAFKEAVKDRPDIAMSLREDPRLAVARALPGFDL
jgi:hypothetical protein